MKILLAHGNGGEWTHKLIKELLLKKLNNPILAELSDSALIKYKEQIAFSTDSFVVSPLEFCGGDIGKLAVCGTINDLTVQGACPEYLSLALIIEEGLEYSLLERIIASVSLAAKKAGVCFVTGDIKVVEKGSADKIFINTSGIGRVVKNIRLSVRNIAPGDKIIVSGPIGQHGLAVLSGRKQAGLNLDIKSDCAALNSLIVPLLKKVKGIRFMRDPTRGGLATTLNEVARDANLGIALQESDIPVAEKVRVACELLGMDPLYLANEGRAVIIVKEGSARKVLNFLRKHPLGRGASQIGNVTSGHKGRLILNTVSGARRIVDMLTNQLLPRIC